MTRWRTVRLDDVCEKITDGTHRSPVNGPAGEFKYVTAKNIKPWGLDLTDITYIDAATHRGIYARCDVRRDDVLYVKDGATAGRVALNTLDEQFSLLSSVGMLRPGPLIAPKYLVYVLQVPRVLDRMLGDVAGVAITRLTLRKIKDAVIPLVPREHQDSLVAEIDTQFSRLDEAVANLQRVKANLKRYKAAVLKAAIGGRLVPTEAELARRESRYYQTGEQLLSEMRFERQASGKGARRELLEPVTCDLVQAPEGWVWTTCDAVIEGIDAGASFKCTERPPTADEIGVLKVSAVSWGVYDEDESKTCNDLSRVDRRYLVQEGDFLFSRANTIDLVGACVIVGSVKKQLLLSDKTLRFRLTDGVPPMWLLICLRSKFGRDEIERLATGNQESMRNIGQERIRQIRIPLPPLAEQRRIAEEVDRRLSLLDEVNREVEVNLRRARALRQSVLARAFFSGNS